MYKNDLVKRVAKDTRLSQRVVSDVLTMLLKEMTLGLARDEKVVFPGFGSFYTRIRPASQARSFTTGKTITVPSMRVVNFRVGEVLKKAVRESKLVPSRSKKRLGFLGT